MDRSIAAGKRWFRDVDSNHDTQLQRLMSYRLDDPGAAANSLAEPKECAKLPVSSPWKSIGQIVRRAAVSAKLLRLSSPQERWPSGLRRTLGKRV